MSERIERYIIVEHDGKTSEAFRVSGTPEQIERQAQERRESGDYQSVTVAMACAATPVPDLNNLKASLHWFEINGPSDAVYTPIYRAANAYLALQSQPKDESKLVEAARAVVERWETPLWKDVPATAEFINKLKQALDAP